MATMEEMDKDFQSAIAFFAFNDLGEMDPTMSGEAVAKLARVAMDCRSKWGHWEAKAQERERIIQIQDEQIKWLQHRYEMKCIDND